MILLTRSKYNKISILIDFKALPSALCFSAGLCPCRTLRPKKHFNNINLLSLD